MLFRIENALDSDSVRVTMGRSSATLRFAEWDDFKLVVAEFEKCPKTADAGVQLIGGVLSSFRILKRAPAKGLDEKAE